MAGRKSYPQAKSVGGPYVFKCSICSYVPPVDKSIFFNKINDLQKSDGEKFNNKSEKFNSNGEKFNNKSEKFNNERKLSTGQKREK